MSMGDAMMHNFNLLPAELQSTIMDLRGFGVDEPTINMTIGRILGALEQKSNKVQIDVWEIERSLSSKIDRASIAISSKIEQDIHTMHGATNEMLIDLRSAQQIAHPQIEEAARGIAEIKKSWADMDTWRGLVDAWRDLVDAWRSTLDNRMDVVVDDLDLLRVDLRQFQDAFVQRGLLLDRIVRDIEAIKHDTLVDQVQRDERMQLTAGLKRILGRWDEVETLLDTYAK